MDRIVVGNRELHGRAYVASFGFKGSDQQKKVGQLSGGERNRVQLAKVLKSGGNVLLLDEPTNDLDVDTLRALEDALLGFPGCVVVISHDRWFLDRVSTHVLAFEGDSEVRWWEGNFTDYEADRKKRLGHRRRPAPPTPLQAPGAGLTGGDEGTAPVDHGAAGPVHVGGPAQPLEDPDHVGRRCRPARPPRRGGLTGETRGGRCARRRRS